MADVSRGKKGSSSSSSCYLSGISIFVMFFFFSSRRRHTRLQGDWSSDVCSSDLEASDQLSGKGHALSLSDFRRGVAKLASGAGGPRWRRGERLEGDPRTAAGRRSEERRVGEEGRSRGAPDHLKKKKRKMIDGRRY